MNRVRALFGLILATAIAATSVVATAQRPPASTKPSPEPQPGQVLISAKDLSAAIDQLGNLDFATRMNAGRTVRRTPASDAVPALINAATDHKDGYVRFRALVLLTGFNDPRTDELMLRVLKEKSDRLRAVAYGYLAHTPRPDLVPRLLQELPGETAEFVRPALVRALAAQGSDPRVRQALLVEVGRGQDFFRSAVIEALGDYRAQYAVPDLIATTQRDGPLRQDAVVALGKIGDQRALVPLVELQRSAPRELQPLVAAALCLLRVDCPAQVDYLAKTVTFGQQTSGFQVLLRNATIALSALAASGNRAALQVVWDTGRAAEDPARGPLALAAATVALRNTPLLLTDLEGRQDRDQIISLMQEGFDLLEEDLEEERFFVAVRRAYWQAAESSPARRVAEALIQKLEF